MVTSAGGGAGGGAGGEAAPFLASGASRPDAVPVPGSVLSAAELCAHPEAVGGALAARPPAGEPKGNQLVL